MSSVGRDPFYVQLFFFFTFRVRCWQGPGGPSLSPVCSPSVLLFANRACFTAGDTGHVAGGRLPHRSAAFVSPADYLWYAAVMQAYLFMMLTLLPHPFHHGTIEHARDMEPLVAAFAIQDWQYGHGMELSWNLPEMENEISLSLLAGKTPVTIQTCQFQYAGELRQRGRLTALQTRVRQQTFTPSAMAGIMKELDTQHHVDALFNQLEDIINFIGTIGGTTVRQIDGAQLLHVYVLDTLLLDVVSWETTSTPSIRQHVRLHHLQTLYLALEERMHGSPLEKVLLRYREPLEPALLSRLQTAKKQIDREVLIPVLRDFMVDQLSTVIP